MSLLPVLETHVTPTDRQWYAVRPSGSGPGVSVGHSCWFLSSSNGGRGRVFITGGADQHQAFTHTHFIDLDSLTWGVSRWEGLLPRYEHSSFVPAHTPRSLWVFGGADMSGNHNSVQVLHAPEELDGNASWKTVVALGGAPTPRTYRTSSACVGERLFVFSGGREGVAPVSDPRLHVFHSVSGTWTQPDTSGTPPSPRQGHTITAVGAVIYFHGGMSGETLLGDMFALHTETLEWEELTVGGDVPPAMAAHASVSCGSDIIIFGGLTVGGASDGLFRFQCGERRWRRILCEGVGPAPRLDHGVCVVPWHEGRRLLLVFGGMDAHGQMFSDCLVTCVGENE